jgi:hypothetical protein
MNTRDRFDDQLASRLRETAPGEAPDRLLDLTISRITNTPQRGRSRGWFSSPFGRVLAVAAVVALAVVVGTQLPGALERPVGNDASPSASTGPSADSSSSPSPTPAPTASATDPQESEPAVAEDSLVLRLVSAGGGPTYPGDQVPKVTLLNDGTLIWQPTPDVSRALVTRQLTDAGLAALREHIFGSGLLDTSATHQLQPLPGAEPPGRGVAVHTFTAGEGDDQVVVASVQWLGDDEEATYYEPSPERQQLDQLVQDLRDPEALVAADAWTGPAEAYEASEYLLLLTPYRDVPPYDTTDVSEIRLPVEGPLDEFGVVTGSAPPTRCGLVGQAEAAAIVEDLVAAGYEQVGLDRATTGSLDWAEGSGTVDLVLVPSMPDGYPACEDLW